MSMMTASLPCEAVFLVLRGLFAPFFVVFKSFHAPKNSY